MGDQFRDFHSPGESCWGEGEDGTDSGSISRLASAGHVTEWMWAWGGWRVGLTSCSGRWGPLPQSEGTVRGRGLGRSRSQSETVLSV